MQAVSETEEGELVLDADSDDQLLLSPSLKLASSSIAKEEGLEAAVSPPPALPMDISLVRWPTSQLETSEKLEQPKNYRYPNPGGNFYTGMNTKSEDAIKRRQARKMRFGLQDTPMRLAVERRAVRAKRFGTKLVATGVETIKLVDSLPEIPDGEVRLEAIHLYGTDEMSTKDVFAYFKLYSPRNIEWVNDSSCNVVWEDNYSASRALLGLGKQPLALRSQFDSMDLAETDTSTDSSQNQTVESPPTQNQNEAGSKDQDQTVKSPPKQDQNEAGQSSKDQNQTSESNITQSSQNQTEASTSDQNQNLSEPDATMETDHTPELSQGDGDGTSPHKVEDNAHLLQWRYGESHPKAKQLLLRYATVLDVKKKGAAMRSAYYKKHGRPPVPAFSLSVVEEEDAEEAEPREDLRSRIEKRKLEDRQEPENEEEEEMAYTSPSDDNPFARLVKRPRPLHSDRPSDSLDVTAMMAESEKQRMLAEVESGRVGLGGDEGDLRRALQRKKKHRNLKLRLGHNPRLVEERH